MSNKEYDSTGAECPTAPKNFVGTMSVTDFIRVFRPELTEAQINTLRVMRSEGRLC